MANLRVLDNKTGQPVNNVTVDNLKNYINNPAYSIDSNSLIPVEIQGKQDIIPVSQFDSNSMKLRDSSYESPYQKYNSAGAQAQNIGRQTANALTLGGFAAISDRFKSPEELNDAKLRESFNPISTFVGQALPYAIPIAGEAFGALKAGTTALRLGEITTAGMQSNAARMVSAAAIDGAAQGLTVGINEASLNDQLTKENLSNVLFSTLLGGTAGLGVGGVVAGVSKASSIYSGIGSKIGRGEKIPSGGEKFSQDLSKVVDSQSASETQLSQRQVNLESLTNLSNKIEEGAKAAASGLPVSENHAINSELFAGLAANDKILDDIVNGKIDAQQFFNNTSRYKELSKKAGQIAGASESNPRNMIAMQLNDDMSSVQSLAKDFNKASVDLEKIKIAESTESSIPSQFHSYVYDQVYTGNNSLNKNFFKTIDQYGSEKGIFERLRGSYPNASNDTLTSLVASEKAAYKPSLLETFKSGVLKEGAVLENKVSPSPSDIYHYVDQSLTSLDKGWAEYKSNLPLGTFPTKAETELYKSLKQPFYDEITNSNATQFFGSTAVQRAQSKQIRAELISATNDVKKLIGQKGGDEIDLVKLGKLRSLGMGQGNPQVAKIAPKVLGNYVETVKAVLPKMKALYPELDDSALNVIAQKADNIKQGLDDIYLVNNKRVTDYWKGTERAAQDKTLHGTSPKTRIIRAAHDLAEGNIMYAKMQGIGLLSDLTSSKILSALGKSTTPQEIVAKRSQTLKAISDGNKKLTDKIGDIAKKLVAIKQVKIAGVAAAAMDTGSMPWSIRHRTDKGSHEEINNKYNESVKNINQLITMTGDRIGELDAQMKGIGALSPNLYQNMMNDILMKAGIITRSLPLQSPASYGKSPLTMIEKSHFIDQVEAGTNPQKMLDMIGQGTITPSQLSTFQAIYPHLYGTLKDNALMELSIAKHPVPPTQKAKIYGMFGIETSPVISQGRLMQQLQNQQMAQTQSPPQQGTQGSRVTTSGVQKAHFSQNYQRNGKP